MGIIQFFVSARKLKVHFFSCGCATLPTLSLCPILHMRCLRAASCLCVAAAEGTARRPSLHPWAPGSWAGGFLHPGRGTLLEEAADPAFVLQDLRALRPHPPVRANREALENKNISCFIDLCILKLSAIMICLPEEKVVVILEGMQERSKGASQGHRLCAVCLLTQSVTL